MKVKIISDYGEVYEPGRIISVDNLTGDYIDVLDENTDADIINFLHTVDESTALKFVCDMWGIIVEKID